MMSSSSNSQGHRGRVKNPEKDGRLKANRKKVPRKSGDEPSGDEPQAEKDEDKKECSPPARG